MKPADSSKQGQNLQVKRPELLFTTSFSGYPAVILSNTTIKGKNQSKQGLLTKG
jgi:hypothetical protein